MATSLLFAPWSIGKDQNSPPHRMGTWAAATWAIRFYEKRGFWKVKPAEKDRLLRTSWSIPQRHVEASVVLANADLSASAGPSSFPGLTVARTVVFGDTPAHVVPLRRAGAERSGRMDCHVVAQGRQSFTRPAVSWRKIIGHGPPHHLSQGADAHVRDFQLGIVARMK